MTSLASALRKAGLAAALPLACSSGETAFEFESSAATVGSVASKTEQIVAAAALPIRGHPRDYDALISDVGGRRFVLLGEATHGTREFYRERARISMRLVRERGFRAVIIEGDWPDTGRVNRYVRGVGDDKSAASALSDFSDFPEWMWRNSEFAAFVEELRAHNDRLPVAQRVGVYGMDVYNLFGAADAVVAYLDQVDTSAAMKARRQYRCFARYRPDPARYGEATRRPGRSCAGEAATVLAELRARVRPSDPAAAEAHFSAMRSAASVAGAEEYYRSAYAGTLSWNVRDRRMAQTAVETADHVGQLSGTPGKALIWAHNSHVGDARATDMPLRGEINLGQLMREQFGEGVYLLGFTTYEGKVIAAGRWDGPHRVMNLRPAQRNSYAGLFHAAALGDAMILLRDTTAAARVLDARRFNREIGVIYAPSSEAESHYTRTRLAGQFDAVIHVDRTSALNPLR